MSVLCVLWNDKRKAEIIIKVIYSRVYLFSGFCPAVCLCNRSVVFESAKISRLRFYFYGMRELNENDLLDQAMREWFVCRSFVHSLDILCGSVQCTAYSKFPVLIFCDEMFWFVCFTVFCFIFLFNSQYYTLFASL